MEKFYCGNCGEEISSEANNCPNCGAKFGSEVVNDSAVITAPEVSFDSKVKRTVLGLEKVANIVRVLSIVAAVLIFIGGVIIATDDEVLNGGEVFLVYLIYTAVLLFNAYISYHVFNWLSHMLNCVYQLTKKKK